MKESQWAMSTKFGVNITQSGEYDVWRRYADGRNDFLNML